MDSILVSTQGEHPDITWAVDSLYLTYQLGATLFVEWRSPNLKLFKIWTIDLRGGEGAFGRIFHHHKVHVGYRLGGPPYVGYVHPIDEPRSESGPGYLGVVHGALPIVFGEDGYAYITGGATQEYPVNITKWNGEILTNVRSGKGTGLSRLNNLWPTLIDEDRHMVPGISDPSWAGDCVVGATDREGMPCIVAKLPGNLECELWKGQDSPNPRMCTDGTNYYVVVWSGKGHGIRLAKISREDFRIPAHEPCGIKVDEPRALGYFFGKRSKFGTFDVKENCAVLPLDAWQDSNGSLPSGVGLQILDSLRECGVGVISNTAIKYAIPEWKRVIGVFSGRQEGNVWAHEPSSREEAAAWAAEAREEIAQRGLPRRPVITILREDRTKDRQFVGVSEVLAPEIYFTEPQLTFELQLATARTCIAEVCTALAPAKLYLVVQAYDRNLARWKNSPWALEAIQQAANEALALGQVLGLFWFAYSRPGGVLAYPRLVKWHEAQLALTPNLVPIVDPKPPAPKPPAEKPMILPGQAEFEDLMIFLHEVCYQGELKRVSGLYESPDPQNSRIRDPRRPDVVMDNAAFRWLGEYNVRFQNNLTTPGGPHEAAKREIRQLIHDSDEARRKRGEDPQ